MEAQREVRALSSSASGSTKSGPQMLKSSNSTEKAAFTDGVGEAGNFTDFISLNQDLWIKGKWMEVEKLAVFVPPVFITHSMS